MTYDSNLDILNARSHYLSTIFIDCIRSMGEGNVFTGVCLSTGGSALGGIWFCLGREGSGLGGGSHQKADPIQKADPPPRRQPGNKVNRRSVRMLLECILVPKATTRYH